MYRHPERDVGLRVEVGVCLGEYCRSAEHAHTGVSPSAHLVAASL